MRSRTEVSVVRSQMPVCSSVGEETGSGSDGAINFFVVLPATSIVDRLHATCMSLEDMIGVPVGQGSWMSVCYVVLMLIGGVLARKKGDYASRGVAVTFITGIFGILLMLFSPRSNVRTGTGPDPTLGPPHAHIAVFGQMLFLFIWLMAK